MTNPKRGRGRPKGPGIDDTARLEKVAELMIATPGLKATGAMKRTDPAPNETVLRRLQVKWKVEGPNLLDRAAERQATLRAKEIERSTSPSAGGSYGLSAIADMNRRMRAMQRLEDLAAGFENPLMKAARESNALIEAAMGVSNASKTMDAIYNSPAMRAVRMIEESPTMRAIRQFEDSPTMRMIREMDRLKKFGF